MYSTCTVHEHVIETSQQCICTISTVGKVTPFNVWYIVHCLEIDCYSNNIIDAHYQDLLNGSTSINQIFQWFNYSTCIYYIHCKNPQISTSIIINQGTTTCTRIIL